MKKTCLQNIGSVYTFGFSIYFFFQIQTELHFNDNEKQLQDIKTDFEQCQTQLNSKSEEISKLKTRQDRLNLELEEKVHDLAMARNNIEQLKVMLEEKSSTSENNQMERLQNIAGMNIYLSFA